MDQETFLTRMTPMARWAARRRAAPHPLLGADDLFQEALEALCRVWQQRYPKSPDDLCRIGRVAVLRRLSDVRAHAWSHGEGEVPAWVDLDQEVARFSPIDRGWGEGTPPSSPVRISEVLGAEGIEDIFFWFELEELERSLDATGQAVLGELLDPGVRTLRAIRRVWRARAGQRGNWWAKYREEVIARGLHIKPGVVKEALGAVRTAARQIFLGEEIPAGRYRETEGVGLTTKKGKAGKAMGNEKAPFVPDSQDEQLPEPKQSAPAATTAKMVKAKTGAEKPRRRAPVEKKAGNRDKKSSNGKGPGVIATIVKICSGAGATKEKILSVLKDTFPKRPIKGMGATLNVQLGGRLEKAGFKIHRVEKEGAKTIYQIKAPAK